MTTTVTKTVTVASMYRRHSAGYYAWKLRQSNTKLRSVKAHLRVRWQPTVGYAIRLASAVTGVPQSEIRTVAFCESKFDPFATNGKYKGVMQLGWSPFGFSPFDPVANVLSAAMTVKADGSWRQWECSAR